MGRSQELYKKAKRIIPGGTQLFSKRAELMLPGLWPAYYEKARGCGIWDLDGKEYTDMSYMGIGACILGYADSDVDAAVKKAVANGIMSTLNCPEEIELAELLCSLHPWAAMARFARTGGEAAAMAVRIARARTGRQLILFCGYHGWHDWYLAANLSGEGALDGHLLPGLEPKGVPRCLRGTAIPFNYNDTAGFLKLAKARKKEIAAVIMEPIRNYYPTKGFLDAISTVTEKAGAVLIFDEITSGWRLCEGGAHLALGVSPDMAIFGKGMSNGYPMAAVIGRRGVMKAAEEAFISSTYWTERTGPAAALAAIRKMKKLKVPRHLIRTGRTVRDGWVRLADKNGLDIEVSGIYPLSHFIFKHKKPAVLKTLFTQLMLEKGFLATTAFYASYAHKERHVNRYLRAVDQAFASIARAAGTGHPEKYLKGPVCHSGFRRLT
jgi:glutamate-1-semialdehyde aminotransferase